ncbi:MAG: hypothetical protein AAFQ90_08755 [Pseudomonadota bacterium]
MDTLRGTFESGDHSDRHDFDDSHDLSADPEGGEAARDLPPSTIGQDERRMQVRAYNHWAGLLGERTYPSIEDLDLDSLTDFGPYSVLLDFSTGIEDPIVRFLGDELAEECSARIPIERLSDVPPRSLLSRITDHYMQIMANQAPIGFEAEFVNQRSASILYRGILLPFSSDDESIDFIYGVINWKEMADAATADELLLEIDQALDTDEGEADAAPPARHHEDAIEDWADSPAHEAGEVEDTPLISPLSDNLDDNVADFEAAYEPRPESGEPELPVPDFGQYTLDDPYEDEDGEEDEDDSSADYSFASLSDHIDAPTRKAVDLDAEMFDPDDYRVEDAADEPAVPVAYAAPVDAGSADEANTAEGAQSAPLDALRDYDAADDTAEPAAAALQDDADLLDCLASARQLAESARASEDRSRQALYAAVGRAYDFSLAAKQVPAEYETLIEESGLTVQERAPMTPVVKLVFGGDYDKTRITEYAAVLSHAHRLDLERGALADFLSQADGGLKGIVNAERRLRREEAGKAVEPAHAIREALAKKLRELEALTLAAEGPEFALVMVRRREGEDIAVIGEVHDDVALIERAARKLVG